ncbi:MAG: hypothetical protein V1775_06235 [Bacteroidota bacterium]
MKYAKKLKSLVKKLFAVMLSAGLLMSCHKDPPAPPDTTGDYCGLASVSDQFNKMRNSYEYFPDHKIRKIITYDTANGTIDYYSAYSYGALQIVNTYFSAYGSPGYAQYYHLNEQGYPGMKTVNSIFRNDTTFYGYDVDGYLVKSIRKNSSGVYDTLHYSYSEGRRTTIVSHVTGPSLDSIKYEYYDFKIPHNTLALLNNEHDTTIDPAENELFLGKNTDLAVKTKIVRYKNDSQHILLYEYSYEFDADSNLTKMKGSVGYLNSYTLHTYELNISVECK